MAKASTIATTDTVSCIALFCRQMDAALKAASGIGLNDYRILAFLDQRQAGARPGEIAAALGIKQSTLSGRLATLEELGVIARKREGAGVLCTNAKGSQACLRKCDTALVPAFWDFFAGVDGPDRRRLLDGSIVTSSVWQVSRMVDADYLGEFSALTGISLCELMFINTTQMTGLSLGEYRVLLCLLEHPGTNTFNDIRAMLCTHKSETSLWCNSLARKGLVEKRQDRLDKRAYALLLTEEGRRMCDETTSLVVAGGARDAQRGEVEFYNELFERVMAERRAK